MPFKSEAQRRYMWAKHPRIARRWADEAKAGKDKKKEHPAVRALRKTK